MALEFSGTHVRLVASDLDGTLLRHWVRKPDPAVFPLIDELLGRGVLFMAASGRQYASLRRLFAPVADRISYLCENGALVMHGGRPVVMRTMDRDLVLEIADAVLGYPGCEPFVSAVSTCYTLERQPGLRDHLVNVTGNDVTPIDDFAHIDEPMLKLAFKAPEQTMVEASEHFKRLFGDRCNVVTSGAIWEDFTPSGVDKGAALAAFAAVVGIDLAEMAAFGDNDNDREMLDAVGLPFLMRDGNPALRDLNGRIRLCDTVEDTLERMLAPRA